MLQGKNSRQSQGCSKKCCMSVTTDRHLIVKIMKNQFMVFNTKYCCNNKNLVVVTDTKFTFIIFNPTVNIIETLVQFR